MPCGQPSSAASIWPVWLAVVVDRLLAEDDEARASPPRRRLCRILATASGSTMPSVLTRMPRSAPMASAVRMVSCGLLRADRDGDDLGRLALLLQADRLLDGDLVEGVHRHLDVGELDARAVRLDADLDVVVDHPLHAAPGSSSGCFLTRERTASRQPARHRAATERPATRNATGRTVTTPLRQCQRDVSSADAPSRLASRRLRPAPAPDRSGGAARE